MTMSPMDLIELLRRHHRWLTGCPDGAKADLSEADLRGADLRGANLRGADLRGANLSGADLHRADLQRAALCVADLQRADLSGADLRGADLDYSCWPLWCGSIGVTIDERIARQLVYHALTVALPHMPAGAVTPELIEWANGFHRVGQVPALMQT